MSEKNLLQGAEKIMKICTKTLPGERVLIVTDKPMTKLALPLINSAKNIGAEPLHLIMEERKRHGEEPPENIAEALLKTDVFFLLVNTSITHTNAVKKAVEAGARGLVMTNFTEEMFVSGGIEADFVTQAEVCKKLAAIFEAGNEVLLTTPAGTNLKLNASGRRGNALTGIVEKGEFSTIPTIEANFAPVEDCAEGIIVADASIPYLGIGVLKEPVKLTVENGYITKIEGGKEARILKNNLESQQDPNVFNIAELGVGLNPRAMLCGLMLEDEGVLGVVHIGIGTSLNLGGTIKTKTHYDLLMHKATINVDGIEVLKNGELNF